jgi:predicted methyltransferase
VQLKKDRERGEEIRESRGRHKERVKNRESSHKSVVRETRKTTRTRGKIISSLSYIAKKEFIKSNGFLKLLSTKRGRLSLVFRGKKAKVFHLSALHPLHSNKQDPQV